MKLVCCVDDIMGMAFFGRRQSRDALLYEDLTTEALGKTIHMQQRSASLFSATEASIYISEAPWENAADDEFCFVEFCSPSSFGDKINEIILYRWNRRYQSDVKFDIDLSNWKKLSESEFPGSSHEKITKEVYIRE
ncbi:MAG: ribonuclease Z [Ruminococcaceae bacterium]|nr:ribonuclease Z [Oscillospiraceae bacterium]